MFTPTTTKSAGAAPAPNVRCAPAVASLTQQRTLPMPRLTTIIGSTRPGRAGLPIATWFVDRARVHGGFDVDVVDLADLGLPLLDEPNHPRLRQYLHQHTQDWSAIVDASDAFVMVTPE